MSRPRDLATAFIAVQYAKERDEWKAMTPEELRSWWDSAAIDALFGDGYNFENPPEVSRRSSPAHEIFGRRVYSNQHSMQHAGGWVDATVEIIDRGHEHGEQRYAVVASTPTRTRWRLLPHVNLGSGNKNDAAYAVRQIHLGHLARQFAGLIDPSAVHMPAPVLSDWLRDRGHDEQADALLGKD